MYRNNSFNKAKNVGVEAKNNKCQPIVINYIQMFKLHHKVNIVKEGNSSLVP